MHFQVNYIAPFLVSDIQIMFESLIMFQTKAMQPEPTAQAKLQTICRAYSTGDHILRWIVLQRIKGAAIVGGTGKNYTSQSEGLDELRQDSED